MNSRQKMVSENRAKQKLVLELLIIFVFTIVIFVFASHYDILEKIVEFTWLHENWELDEIIPVSIFLVFALAIFSMRRLREVRKSESVLLHLNEELQKALSEVKQLRGIIPICSGCKKIRDDAGYLHQVESYIHDHTEAQFSHGICPDCMKRLYPDFEGEPKEEEELS